MKLITAVLLSLAVSAHASQIILNNIEEDENALKLIAYEAEHPAEYSGFSLNLDQNRFVQFDPEGSPVVLTEREKIWARANGINFMDITETLDLGSYAHLRKITQSPFPAPNATKTVKFVTKTLTTDGMIENLEKFTSFRTRYYRSDTGYDSQQWLLSKIEEITSTYASKSLRERISISEFPHSWRQSSIIVRINGSDSEEGVIIIGAHQDSAHAWPFLPAPGADDDGSGTMSILEAYRGLISAGFKPQRTVEFHWYSAEEGGLLGSQAVARDYEARAVNVLAMSQFDMTAWVKKGTKEAVGVITDFTDSALTKFNKALIEQYLDIPFVETKCGYACSDHASWSKAGYPSIFTIESKFEESNKFIHSGNDRIDISDEFSFDHMLEFAKLAAAFAIELGQWSKV